ncbi:MAG: ribonuclease Z [Bacteroidaceae bacterium]
MEKFELHILGCGSALPTSRHYASSQVVNLREKLFMIDCGEGAQIQLRRSKLNFSRIGHIFISHIHGDHCFGLIGLISTFSLLGRTNTLHIHAPKELEAVLQLQLSTFCHGLEYQIEFHAINTKIHTLIYEDRSVCVWSLPLNHRIPCCGFLFCESQTLPHIRRDNLDFYHIPNYAIKDIKEGADWKMPDGQIIPNEKLTIPAAPARKYAYCSDTSYHPKLIELIAGANLLFHEATFSETEKKRAAETFHSTARQAATIARESHVDRLVIGHYSSRYTDERILLNEAKQIFPNTLLAEENLVIEV